VALLEPNDPSGKALLTFPLPHQSPTSSLPFRLSLTSHDKIDVTEIIGTGKIDMGFKAMIHTLAAKARGFPVTSISSLLGEPFTGVVYLKDSGIMTGFRSLKGKKIGYVGEFGKVCPPFVPITQATELKLKLMKIDPNRRTHQVLRHETNWL